MTTRMDVEPDVLLSTDDICKIIPLSKETIISYIKNGDLKGFYVGRRYFAYRSKVHEFLAQCAIDAEQETGGSMCDSTYYNTQFTQVHKENSEGD